MNQCGRNDYVCVFVCLSITTHYTGIHWRHYISSTRHHLPTWPRREEEEEEGDPRIILAARVWVSCSSSSSSSSSRRGAWRSLRSKDTAGSEETKREGGKVISHPFTHLCTHFNVNVPWPCVVEGGEEGGGGKEGRTKWRKEKEEEVQVEGGGRRRKMEERGRKMEERRRKMEEGGRRRRQAWQTRIYYSV